ncbi:GpE family phage tail protein [Candidatus Sororendozoicomonas aggregata]
MANLAVIFHWSLSDMKTMPLEELAAYHKLALERAKVKSG